MLIRGVVSSPVRGVVGSGFGGGIGPEGDAYFYADFRYPTQYFYLDGVAYQQFTDIPGATSVGGAGFGMVQRNGIWTPVPADAPLIGDGGLMVPESKGELVGLSCRPADALWLITGGTKAAGSTYRGIYQGAKAVSAGANWHRLNVPSGATVTTGQLYTVVARYKAGTSNRVLVELRNAVGGTVSQAAGVIASISIVVQNSGTLTVVEDADEGDGVRRTVLAWTPNFTGSINSSGIGPNSTVVGEDIEVLGLSVQAGAYVNNPPIDNENLPATRTAVAQSVGGLTPPSGDFEISQRANFPIGAGSTSQRFVDWNDGSDDNKLVVERNSASDIVFVNLVSGVSTTFATFGGKSGPRTVDWALRKVGSDLIAICDGVERAPVAMATPAGINSLQLGSFRGGGGGQLNGFIERQTLRYG